MTLNLKTNIYLSFSMNRYKFNRYAVLKSLGLYVFTITKPLRGIRAIEVIIYYNIGTATRCFFNRSLFEYKKRKVH